MTESRKTARTCRLAQSGSTALARLGPLRDQIVRGEHEGLVEAPELDIVRGDALARQVLPVRSLFICDGCTGCACKMDHVEALEANLGAPAAEVRPGIVKRITEFD